MYLADDATGSNETLVAVTSSSDLQLIIPQGHRNPDYLHPKHNLGVSQK